jgi:hypothetical protein
MYLYLNIFKNILPQKNSYLVVPYQKYSVSIGCIRLITMSLSNTFNNDNDYLPYFVIRIFDASSKINSETVSVLSPKIICICMKYNYSCQHYIYYAVFIKFIHKTIRLKFIISFPIYGHNI